MANVTAGVGGKKVDPKKDAGKGAAKGGAKGAAPVEDKNVPQNIQIEYEEIPEGDNFIILEKRFNANLGIKSAKKASAPGGAGKQG